MAIARVQGLGSNNGSFNGTNTTITVTLGAAVASGNTICGGFVGSGPATLTVVSLTDDKGNSYNVETQVGNGSSINAAAFSRTNITNGPTVWTLVVAGAVGMTLIVDEFSGTSTTSTDERDGSAHGGQNQASPGTGTNGVTSGSFTTSTNGDLLYGSTTNDTSLGNATLTAGTTTNASYTAATTSPFTAFSNLQMNSEWAEQSAASASTAATWTQSQNDARQTFLIAIKPAAGATLVTGWQNNSSDIYYARLPKISTAPAIALTPATLPPIISGIAWFESPDVYEPKRWFLQDAPGYGRPSLSQLIGVPWANWLDVLPKAPPKQQPSAALALTPATLPPVISGMAWFTTTDVHQPRRWFTNEPSQVPYAPATITWSFFSSDTVFLPDPPIDYPPALGRTPPAQPVGISGIAWFVPTDRDRPAVKINGESQPAISLTPATLPPQIAGVAWIRNSELQIVTKARSWSDFGPAWAAQVIIQMAPIVGQAEWIIRARRRGHR